MNAADAPIVTLTFDNGPTPDTTERVLDVLAALGVPAIFFVIGVRANAPEGRHLVRRAVAEGHRIGGHTWRHAVPFGELDDDGVRREIERTGALVAELGGDAHLFRPYATGGAIDDRLMSPFAAQLLRERGDTCVLWNCLPLDWIDEHDWAARAIEHVDTNPSSTIVLHDVPAAAVTHLEAFLEALVARRVRFSVDPPDECTPIRAGVPTASWSLLGVGEPTTSR